MTKDVTKYEYEDLRKRIEARLRAKEGWGDAYESTVGQTLIDVAADITDTLSYMLERRSQENFQSTARLRTSVATKSSESGYRSRRAIASSGTVELSLVDENGLPKIVPMGGRVVIPEGTPLTFDGEQFFTINENEIQQGMSSTRFDVIEGVLETLTFDPTTDEDFLRGHYVLIEDYEYIDEDSLVVTAGGVEYKDVKGGDDTGVGVLSFADRLNLEDPTTGSYYDVRYTHDGMRVQFGNNIFGRSPSDPITITFTRTKGSAVRVLSLGNEFRFNFDTFGDGVNVTPPNEYEYVLKNITQVTGGREPESIDEVRTASPVFITTNDRAVTLAGYGFWARRSNIGGIIDAKAYGEAELDTLLYNLNNVYISYLTEDGGELSAENKQRLINYVKSRDVGLAHIIPKKSDEIELGLDVKVKKVAGVQIIEPDFYAVVRGFLMDYFKRTRDSIGREYQKSDLIRNFYDLQVRVGGANYDVIDFVDIQIHAYQKAMYPDKVNSVITRLRVDNADVSVGDTFTLTIDGHDHTVSVEAEDLVDGQVYVNLLYKMRDKLFLDTNIIPSVYVVTDGINNEYVLELNSRDGLGGFIIQNKKGTLAPSSALNFNMQIVPRRFNNEFEDIILRKSISILDESGKELYHDNGNGRWVDTATGEMVGFDPNDPAGGEDIVGLTDMIDYVTAKLTLPEVPEGTYYVRYKQDAFDNFMPNDSATVTLIPPTEHWEDVGQTFSTIALLPS